jgi:hypothetical protein
MRRHGITLLFALGILLSFGALSHAQDGAGQLCIRAYDDRNGNGAFDEGEPFISRDVGVSLANTEGIITHTALLDDSPRASQGLLCFQSLPTGQYNVVVASAAYVATTADFFVATVSQTSVPQVFDFGARLITLEVGTPTRQGQFSPVQLRNLLQRLLFSSLGAGAVMGFMIFLGVVLYFLFVRPRRVLAPANPRATGAMRAVAPYDAPARAVRTLDTDKLTPPSDDDTDRFKPPKS